MPEHAADFGPPLPDYGPLPYAYGPPPGRVAGIFAVYLISTLLVLQFSRLLLWCGRIVGKPMFRLARYAYGKATA